MKSLLLRPMREITWKELREGGDISAALAQLRVDGWRIVSTTNRASFFIERGWRYWVQWLYARIPIVAIDAEYWWLFIPQVGGVGLAFRRRWVTIRLR